MSQGSATDTALMESTASACEELGEDLASRLQEMMVNLEAMDKDLQGSAGNTFKQVKQTLHTEVTNINNQLDDMALGIRTSGRDMDASDSESEASLRAATESVEGVTATNQLTGGK